MDKIQKILIILIGCVLSCHEFQTSAIEYRIISLDNAPIFIDGKKMSQYGTFSKGSKVTNWARCSYFFCKSIETPSRKYFITKYDLNRSNHKTLGSYIYSLKPLSSLGGSIPDLTNWFNRDYYALYSEEDPFSLEFECPDNLPLDDNHYFFISFHDKNGIVRKSVLPYFWDETSNCRIISINISELVPYVGKSMRLTLTLTFRDNIADKDICIADNFNICFIRPDETK